MAFDGFRILKSDMYKKDMANKTKGRTVKKSCSDTNGRNMYIIGKIMAMEVIGSP